MDFFKSSIYLEAGYFLAFCAVTCIVFLTPWCVFSLHDILRFYCDGLKNANLCLYFLCKMIVRRRNTQLKMIAVKIMEKTEENG